MRTTDIAVVGAGPAGIGAALAAANNGARVILIDENDAPGGHLRWMMSHPSGFSGELERKRGVEIANWAATAMREAGIELLTRTVAWGLFEGNTLGLVSGDEPFELRSGSVILATGATDIVWPFPGWELPGVMSATAALRMLHLDRILPGRRAVVIGAGQLAEAVASDIDACGGNVVIRLESVDGVTAGGIGVIEWVEAAGDRIECDLVVLALGRQPDCQLALQAHVAAAFSREDGVFIPTRGETLMTSLQDIYVVGDAAGVGSPAQAFAEGTVAGEAATHGSGLRDAFKHLRSVRSTADPLQRVASIDDRTLVCRCEEVSAQVIRTAIADGAVSLNDVKRRTRAGMGICQGVFCNRTMAQMIAEDAGVTIESIVPMTARPPARLIPMAAMADLDA